MNNEETFDALSLIFDQAKRIYGKKIKVAGPIVGDWTVKQYKFKVNGTKYIIRRRYLPFEWGDFADEFAFEVFAFTLCAKGDPAPLASAIRLRPGDQSEIGNFNAYQMSGNFAGNTFTGVWDTATHETSDETRSELLAMLKSAIGS